MRDKRTDKQILSSMVARTGLEPRGYKFGTSGNLLAIDLSFLNLTTLPSELWLFRNLKRFVCMGNSLSALPPEIRSFKKLEQLNVAGSSIVKLPSEIGELTKLRRLFLGHVNHQTASRYDVNDDVRDYRKLQTESDYRNVPHCNAISELPPEISLLRNLTVLDCTLNLLKSLPEEIGLLTNLKSLFLGFNFLERLPSAIGQLSSLTGLYLHHNSLAELPLEISHLTNLATLTLSFNPLKQIPFEIGRLNQMKRLDLSGCEHLLTPPPEISDQGTPPVLNFLRELEADSTIRFEAKLLVVGEGGTGKSSLLRTLSRTESSTLSTTHGIEVGTYRLSHPLRFDTELILNTWDFGGQEIYHATHQFFLTRRSLYLVVWNSRLGAEQGRLHYWLDTIKALAPDAPVLLIATHIDERDPDLNYPLYLEAFPQLTGTVSVSNLTSQGFEELKLVMSKHAASLPLMGQPWPSTWIAVERELLSLPDHHINADTYMAFCQKHGVQAQMAQGTLGGYLHDLGKILFFRDDYLLRNLIVLKPNWVTKAISQVLTDEKTREQKGILTHGDLPRIWAHDENGQAYEPHLYPIFLRLMERFDLSYQIEADTPGDHPTRSLVPQLLPHQPPPTLMPWPQNPSEGEAQLDMVYKLDFVPAGIMSWFIVRTHPYTKGLHWREGVVLEYQGHQGRTELNPMVREIRIATWGVQPHNFFTILKNTLDLILGRFEGLRVSREVPCICHRDGDNTPACSRFYPYDDLVRRMRNRRYWVECPETFLRVSVPTLLYGIHATTDAQVIDDIKQTQQDILDQLGNLTKLDLIIQKLNQQSELIVRNFTRQWNLEMQKLESECPNTFWLATHGRETFNPKDWIGQEYRMFLICQHPPAPHSVGDGYRFRESQEWWKSIRPWLDQLLKFVKYGVPLGKAVEAVYDESAIKNREAQIGLMEEISKSLPEIMQKDLFEDSHEEHDLANDQFVIGSALRALFKFLDQIDPSHNWGGLSRAITPDGNILWLCAAHRKQFEAKPLILT